MDFDVQNHARTRALRSDGHVRSGPFVVRYDRTWSSPFANYAIPDDGATPTASEVSALISAFRALDRVPRLEYLPSCAPQVEPALLAAGFTTENRASVMVCSAGTLITPRAATNVLITEPTDDAGILATATVQHAGFGQPGEPTSGETAWLRDTMAGGGVVALARVGVGTAVGAGVCSPPVDGLSELAGLAVAASFRRLGIGATVAAYLTAAVLDRGCRTVWLEPGDLGIERIYARIGYRTVGEKLNISLR
ncbi:MULTISPECIES: GNAT family N-acetyltransferase [unclassified Streptomyces]|uniref:GNAT family N-acetyltransferase n=1 Tax=unclassified Streptomyces TaxID=2593676 RepID=UPI002E28793A|nr:GNAT family N-acetyltransferase [Streptomyces sp. NBC_00223]